MKRLFLTVALGCSLPLSASGQAPSPAVPAENIRVFLMEGSVVSGQLSVESLTVKTAFGTLTVPVEHVVSFTPGLDSHPELRKRIGRLIQQLGSNDAAERETAQRALVDFGEPIRSQIEAFRTDEDTERRTRILAIIENLDELQQDAFTTGVAATLVAEDTVTTDRFTVVGRIEPESFQVETAFGPLTVALSDIRTVARQTREKPEVRKRFTLSETDLIPRKFQETGLQLGRGDEVAITASGQLTMSPWGNNMTTGPDGSGNLAWYTPGIGAGALVGKIGPRGEEFLVGTRKTFTAEGAGILYLGIAMPANFANRGMNFPGQYEVRVRVKPQ